MTKNKLIVVIPAFNPSDDLETYIIHLNCQIECHILIVDDGSQESCVSLFKRIENFSNCTILHHEVNKGKGAALKTAFSYILTHFLNDTSIVCADSDGQHTIEDIVKMNNAVIDRPNSLILGERDFSKKGIPFRSVFGNRCSSIVFAMLYGKWIQDTQTGLRGFDVSLLKHLITIEGNRFEYETAVLIDCVRNNIDIYQITIQTVYSDDHQSHFHTFTDGQKVAKVLFGEFFRYTFSSILCAVLDISLAWCILQLLSGMANQQEFLRIIIATVGARIVSIIANFTLNKNLVFKRKEKGNHRLVKYLVLCVIIVCLSSLGVYTLHTLFKMDEIVAKLICDVLLFLLSYYAQELWVFAKGSCQ